MSKFKSLNYNGFLFELTELSAKHGLAINDGAQLYEMERDDYPYSYAVDSQGKLERA